MKRKLVPFLALVLCFCGILYLQLSNASSPQKVAERFLSSLYSVETSSAYETFLAAFAQSKPGDHTEVAAAISVWQEPLAELAEPKLLDKMIASHLLLLYDQAAFEHNCTFHVQNIRLTPTYSAADTVQYRYQTKVQVNYSSGKVASFGSPGDIVLQRQYDGQWLVTAIEPYDRKTFANQLAS